MKEFLRRGGIIEVATPEQRAGPKQATLELREWYAEK
jgi:hypothetical protein